MTASTIPSIGIDFGGTSIKMGVVKGAEVIAHAPSIATQEYGNPDQLIEAIAQFVNMLRTRWYGALILSSATNAKRVKNR